jgi:hypothetical protein
VSQAGVVLIEIGKELQDPLSVNEGARDSRAVYLETGCSRALNGMTIAKGARRNLSVRRAKTRQSAILLSRTDKSRHPTCTPPA